MLFLYVMLLPCAAFALHSTSHMPYASLFLYSLHPACTVTHGSSATLSPTLPPALCTHFSYPFPMFFSPHCSPFPSFSLALCAPSPGGGKGTCCRVGLNDLLELFCSLFLAITKSFLFGAVILSQGAMVPWVALRCF